VKWDPLPQIGVRFGVYLPQIGYSHLPQIGYTYSDNYSRCATLAPFQPDKPEPFQLRQPAPFRLPRQPHFGSQHVGQHKWPADLHIVAAPLLTFDARAGGGFNFNATASPQCTGRPASKQRHDQSSAALIEHAVKKLA
jgi:hypothetical protein